MTGKRGRVYLVEQPNKKFPDELPEHLFLEEDENYFWEEVEALELNDGRSVYMLICSVQNDSDPSQFEDEMEHDKQAEFIAHLRELGYDVRDNVSLS